MLFSKTKRERKKEQEKKEDQQQKTMAEENRERGEKLILALKRAEENVNIGFRSPEVVEKLLDYTKRAQYIVQNVESIGRYSTDAMDRVFRGLIDTYNKALLDGDIATAKLGIYHILEGLLCFRKDLSETEAENAEEVLDKRIKRLEKYQTVLGISNSVFINQKNENKKEEELKKIGIEFDEVFSETKEMMKLRQDLYEEIKNVPAGVALSPEAGKLKAKMSQVNSLKIRMEDVQREITAFHSQRIQQEQALKNLISQLSIEVASLSQEERLSLRRAMEEHLEAIRRSMEETRELVDIMIEGHDRMTEFYTSTRETMHTVETSRTFERILEEEERIQKAKDEGQKRVHEEEQMERETYTL